MIARSCAIAPVFLISNVTVPAFSVVVARMILNSFSVTWTTCGTDDGCVVVVAAVVVDEGAAVVVEAAVDVSAGGAPALCSFGPAPRTLAPGRSPTKQN